MANYRKLARQKAKKYGLDPNIFERQIKQESGFNPSARSPAGAYGIAQIMPATAKGWGVNPADPVASLDAAARNMAQYVKKFGSYKNALVAYNAGPGNVGKPLPAETRDYIKTILGGKEPGRASAPKQSYGADPSGDSRQAIALSLLGMGNLAGGYGGDPLTSALLQAAQQGKAPAATNARATAPTGKMPSGIANFEGHKVAAWIKPYLVKARRMGWKGTINSGYRSYADQQRIYNSGVRPAAKPGTSNHEGTAFPRGAVDVSDAATLAKIMKRLGAPLQWAGAKDPVHFSHPHGGSY